MDLIKNSIIAIPIGVIYYIVSSMLGEVLYKGLPIGERHTNTLIIMFIAGLVGLFLAQALFSKGKMQNTPIQYGLILGSSLLLFYTLVSNWYVSDNEYKLIVYSIVFIILLWFAFKINK